MGKPEGTRPLGRPGRRRKDVSSGSGMWGQDWIDVARDREMWRVLVNAVMNLRVP